MASVPANGRRRLHRAAAAATLAVALTSNLLAGCGGSSSSEGSAGAEGEPPPSTSATVALPADQPQRPACGLVTQAEVEAALGGKVAAGQESAQPGRSVCVFGLAAAGQSVVLLSTSSSGVPAAFEAARAKAESPQSVSAGDQAYVSGGQALVRKGNTMVAILVAVRQPPGQLASVATKLVQSVANRI